MANETNEVGLVFREVDKGEKSRTYIFSDEKKLKFENVARVAVSKSGTHRLELEDGSKFIVNNDWLTILIDAEDWSF